MIRTFGEMVRHLDTHDLRLWPKLWRWSIHEVRSEQVAWHNGVRLFATNYDVSDYGPLYTFRKPLET
eukprot:219927-Alexandrium_andersonii.AAC.1